MSREVFIGIVPTQGSTEVTWTGLFSYSELRGYTS